MSLAPWDMIPYFQPQVERNVPLLTTATQLCGADPMRVLIMFGVPNGGTQYAITTNPNATNQQGFTINANVIPLVLTQHDIGPLITVAWFGVGPLNANASIITLSMQRWFADEGVGRYDQKTVQELINSIRGNVRQYASRSQ